MGVFIPLNIFHSFVRMIKIIFSNYSEICNIARFIASISYKNAYWLNFTPIDRSLPMLFLLFFSPLRNTILLYTTMRLPPLHLGETTYSLSFFVSIGFSSSLDFATMTEFYPYQLLNNIPSCISSTFSLFSFTCRIWPLWTVLN